MYIRSVRLTDLLLLGGMRRQVVRLNLPDALAVGHTALGGALRSWLPGAAGARTFVLGERRPHAYIQVAARSGGHTWEVTALGSDRAETCDAPNHPWRLLLDAVAVVAGRRRVTRLLARVPAAADDLMACFRQAGYHAYGRELLYSKVFAAGDRLTEAGPEPRPQRPSDAWLIHRLYFQTAPRAVQDAEAHTSDQWQLRRARPGGPRERGWLVEDEAELAAYARALSQRRVHIVEWLFQPGQRERLPQLIRQTLARLPAAKGDHVYCCLAEHQAEAGPILEAAGFAPAGEQVLLVKYLAVKAAARERVFASFAPAKARRVPSYLRRAGGHESPAASSGVR